MATGKKKKRKERVAAGWVYSRKTGLGRMMYTIEWMDLTEMTKREDFSY